MTPTKVFYIARDNDYKKEYFFYTNEPSLEGDEFLPKEEDEEVAFVNTDTMSLMGLELLPGQMVKARIEILKEGK